MARVSWSRLALTVAALGCFVMAVMAADVELVGDPQGERGVRVHGLSDKRSTEAVLRLRESAAEPLWELSQWDSRESIAGIPPTRLATGALSWRNRFKEFIMGAGTDDGDFVLAVNSIAEYNGVFRTSGKTPWPHLLLSQTVSAPGGHCAARAPPLADIATMPFRIDVRMRTAEHLHDAARGYSPRLHAAHVMLYLTVQNLNAARAKGYGDYYWFGVTFYDDRAEVPVPHAMPDAGGDPAKGEKRGTGKFIYNVGLTPFADTGLVPGGDWRTLNGDLLPLVLGGLRHAWAQGFLVDSRDLADYRIGGLNIGWEAPGLSAVSFQFRNLSIRACGPGPR